MLEEHNQQYIITDLTIFDDINTPMSFTGELRPYQQIAVDAIVNGVSGTFRGPCGCGKTVILLAAIARIGAPTLVIVHNRALLDQWCAACSTFLKFSPDVISGDRVVDRDRPVTIAMQQKLKNILNDNTARRSMAKRYSVIIGDEVHHWAANTFQHIAGVFHARYRLGASADERRKDGKEFLIRNTFGGLLHKIDRDQLKTTGNVLPITMTMHVTDYIDYLYMDSMSNQEPLDWVGMISRMVCDAERNDQIESIIMEICADPSASVLMLTDRVDPCLVWAERLKKSGISAGYMIGGPQHKHACTDTITGIRSGRIQIGIGTTIADEFLDIPNLTHVVITCPVHQHLKRLRQMIGRVARPGENKQVGHVIYMWDRQMFPYNPHDNTSIENKYIDRLKKLCETIVIRRK